ncbi:MAG: hypothetical protein FWD72_01550 [Eggerthellaceae bacterium]|nr:hypothetical protein [Eggerthellaceae bacterium]
MTNFETKHYPVAGSSALESKQEDNIIEFPFEGNEGKSRCFPMEYLGNKGRMAIAKALETESVQELLHGSLRGKPFNQAKWWQSLLLGASFFVAAIACIYFGR